MANISNESPISLTPGEHNRLDAVWSCHAQNELIPDHTTRYKEPVELAKMHTNRDVVDAPVGDDRSRLDPKNMSTIRKWTIVLIVCSGTCCVTCESSIYTTTYAQMRSELEISSIVATLGLSSFVLGIGTGPLLTGPLSEHFGRRRIYLISWAAFIVLTIPSAVATSIAPIIITRFFCGYAGGTFLSVAGGTVADIFSPEELQKPMALVSLAPFAGPSMGPLIGGFINSYAHWRWTYYFIIIWAAAIFLMIVFFAPETLRTSKPHHHVHGSQKIGIARGRANVSIHQLMLSLQRPFQLLFLEPMCFCLDLYSAILLGILYLFFGAFPLVFRTTHHFNLWQIGLTFLGLITGMSVAACTSNIWSDLRQSLTRDNKGNGGDAEPEFRLPPAILGGILIPVGLFWFGWTMRPDVHWIAPILGSGVFGAGLLLAFTGIFTFLVDAYPRYGASALAANGFARCSFAAVFPLFGTQMYERLGCQWATSILAMLTVVMLPFPWLFFKYGKALRKRSKFAQDPRETEVTRR